MPTSIPCLRALPGRCPGSWKTSIWIALALTLLPPAAWSQERPGGLVLRESRHGKFQIAQHKSGIIELSRAAAKVSVGNPDIADILVMPGDQLYILGKRLGTTNVVVWDKPGRIFEAFDIEITHDLESLKLKLHELLPGEVVKVHSSQNKIILDGEISNVVKMNTALQLAASFLPECAPGAQGGQGSDLGLGAAAAPAAQPAGGGQQGCGPEAIVNMMQIAGAQQVMLEIKVAEIARDVLKRLDANTSLFRFGDRSIQGANSGGLSFPDALFGEEALEIPIFGGGGSSNISGPAIAELQRATPTIDGKGVFLSYLSGEYLFEAALTLSRQKGLGKLLAEPTLTTITGQEAEFLSGGEFPVPVPSDLGEVTIVFKEFGVGVKFLPLVLDSGRISLKLNVSVSELSRDNAVIVGVAQAQSQFIIPSLNKRSAGSSVELADGQTIGIAGLINESTREFIDKIPGLGDVPVIGQLFRSQEFRSGLTELVIFVTPRLARPIQPQQVKLPTDSFVPPSDLEFYLLGRSEGQVSPPPAPPAPRFESGAPQGVPEGGKFGHDL
ncbi:MAG: type II and III secretion system protein family protein [Gammaproteobacteria bacterium]